MANTITSTDLNKNKPQNQPTEVGAFPANQPQKVESYNPNQQRGSGYTNIQRIMQANTGNRLGQAVGGGIQQAGQNVRNQLGQSQQQFNQQTQTQQQMGANDQQLEQRGLSAPTDLNAQDQSRFQQLISGKYQGPTGLQNVNNLQAQANDIGQLRNALGSTGGREGLLQRFVGNPQYTAGQKSLDSLLLGQQSNAQPLAAARRATAGLLPQIQGAIGGAQAVGQQQQALAQTEGQKLQGQFGQAVSDLNTQLASRATDAQAARDAQYQQTLSDLQSGKVSQEEADLLGLAPGQEVTSDVLKNIGQYLTPNALKASAQNVASTQDYAKLNALRQLAGGAAPADAQNILGQYVNQDTHAGEFTNAKAYTPNKEGFTKVAQEQAAQYHKELDPHKASLDSANEIADLVYKRDRAGFNTPDGRKYQQMISDKYPGAAQGGYTRPDWAAANVNSAQRNYADALNRVQQAYGGLQTLQVAPQLQPGTVPAAPAPQDLGLENMPQVK